MIDLILLLFLVFFLSFCACVENSGELGVTSVTDRFASAWLFGPRWDRHYEILNGCRTLLLPLQVVPPWSH
jgi:hypothetical protein